MTQFNIDQMMMQMMRQLMYGTARHIFRDGLGYTEEGFLPISMGVKNLHPKSSLVKRTSLVKKYPELARYCETYTLPPLFAGCIDGANITEAIYSGNRSSHIPGEKVTINIKDLGWSNEDMLQEFFVETKGSGTKLENAVVVSEDTVRSFIKKHKRGRVLSRPLSNEVVFSRNIYRPNGYDCNCPEGTQALGLSEVSLEAYEHFSRLGFKVAPFICRIKFPSEVQELVKGLDSGGVIDDLLAEEKRLMPSFVRAAHLEYDKTNSPKIVRSISDDEKFLRNLSCTLVEDMVTFFEQLAIGTKREGKIYVWDCIAGIEKSFEASDEDLKERVYYDLPSWNMAKDIVIAKTGLYFVDLESSSVNHRSLTRDELKHQQQIYLTVLFKDFLSLLINYNCSIETDYSAMCGRYNDAEKIERASVESFIERLNMSDFISVDLKPEGLEAELKYSSIRPEKYAIGYDKLPKPVQEFKK